MAAPVTLITGARSGMGRRTALLLAQKGHNVFAGARDRVAAAALVDEAHRQGLPLQSVALDVTDTDAVEAAVATVAEAGGRIDHLVNNAGYGLVATVEEATDAEMLRQFDVNVLGVLRMCRAVLPFMRRQGGGVIVNISSFLGCMGLPLLAHYNGSKHAVEGITFSLRHEVRPFGIRVHSVLPGLFGTDFVRRGAVVNAATTAPASPYREIVAKMLPLVAQRINEGPDPLPVAEAVLRVIEDPDAPIRIPVGEEATTFVPMQKELSDEAFESRIRETFGL
jgi:NAD(P)-dependent dehydrogenase (short-subunit alcohol dehydrogenase family)